MKPFLTLGSGIILLAWMYILQKLGIDPKEKKIQGTMNWSLPVLLWIFLLWYINGQPSVRNFILYHLPVPSDKPTSYQESQTEGKRCSCRWSSCKRNSPAPVPRSLWTFRNVSLGWLVCHSHLVVPLESSWTRRTKHGPHTLSFLLLKWRVNQMLDNLPRVNQAACLSQVHLLVVVLWYSGSLPGVLFGWFGFGSWEPQKSLHL